MITMNISYGEFADKFTILDIKRMYIKDQEKRRHIELEHAIMTRKWNELAEKKDLEEVEKLKSKLMHINHILWGLEDSIRELERIGDFGPRFIAISRGIREQNWERFKKKQEIDRLLDSEIREQKEYNPV